jgi:hypothetical protein
LAGFTRYSRDRSFAVLGQNKRFVLLMAAGSIVGSFIVGQLLGIVPTAVLLPLLAAILVISCAGAFCNTFGMDFRCWNICEQCRISEWMEGGVNHYGGHERSELGVEHYQFERVDPARAILERLPHCRSHS